MSTGRPCGSAGNLDLRRSQMQVMASATSCPDSEAIDAYARGASRLPDDTALDRHLNSCPDCLRKFLMQADATLVTGIPDCHAVREVGRGRFGVVYKAWRVNAEPRLVAVKILSSGGAMEESRFAREIAVLKRLHSPWIVRHIESGLADNAQYFVMDYVRGRHLDEFTATKDQSLTVKLRAFELICRAVAEAHDAGIVHRDLKPKNILVDADNEPHILDFGICGLTPMEDASSFRGTITLPGDIIGTLKYMSPEQAWGGVSHAIDQRSDIWSLGVMLYEIVTDGQYPYETGSTPDKPAHEALLERIRKELPRLPKLTSIRRGRDLETILARCLAWEPAHRIDSAGRLAEDLHCYNNDQPIRTRPHRLTYRVNRLCVGAATQTRWLLWTLMVAAVAVGLWASLLLFQVRWHVTSDAPHLQPTSSIGQEAANGVLIAGVGDQTPAAITQFAREKGIDGVGASATTWRGLHARIMERLVNAKPVAVAWDYFFRTAQPQDSEFVAAIRKLEADSIPVILAAARFHAEGKPEISETIRDGLGRTLRAGSIVARDMVRRPGEFVWAFRKPDQTNVPSLALMTFAAILHPHAKLDVAWGQRRMELELLYEVFPGAYLRERDTFQLSTVYEESRSKLAVSPKDMLACSAIDLHVPEFWQARSVPYERLLTCTDDTLLELAEGKIVLFGDMRTQATVQSPDRHTVKYKSGTVENVPGVYLQADAITRLLDRGLMRSGFPPAPGIFLACLGLAALGCALPVGLARHRLFEHKSARWLAGASSVVLGLVGLAMMIESRDAPTVHAGMALASTTLPMAGALWIEFARNRHRVLDRNRRPFDDLSLPAEGTVTLAPQQQTQHQER